MASPSCRAASIRLAAFVTLVAPLMTSSVSAQSAVTTTPVPRGGQLMALHQKFLERTKKGDVDLLFLGDSITQGWNNNAVWQRYYAPRNVANYGIGGDRTEHVLWRIQNGEIDGISPKLVILMIGTNNSGSNSAEDIADGIKAIVKTLREKLPESKILLLGVFPRGAKPNPQRAKLDQVNEMISKLDDHAHVTYLDIGKAFLQPDGTLTKEIMPDFLHLSPKGYRIWAEAMEPTVWRLLDEPSK
jgi:beta-glucosidase